MTPLIWSNEEIIILIEFWNLKSWWHDIIIQKKSQLYQKFVTDVGIASWVVFSHSQLQNIVTFQQELVHHVTLFPSPQQ